MNENQRSEAQSEMDELRQESLARLEWHKVALFLSHFATLNHTKELLKNLCPWDNDKQQEQTTEPMRNAQYYKNATEEIRILMEKGQKLNLENFVLDSFEKELERDALLSPTGLFHISTVLKLAGSLQIFAKTNNLDEFIFPNLISIFKSLKPNQILLHKLLKSVNDQGEILPNASEDLAAAHKRCAQAKKKITENLDLLLKSTTVKNAVQEQTWMLKDGRYVLPVRTDRKNEVDGIARGVSQTGSTVFIEPKSLAAEQALLEKAQLDIQIEEYKIIKNLSQDCALISDDILTSVQALTLLDDISARAQFASILAATPCSYDKFTLGKNFTADTCKFYFHNARHPLFILENKPCVPNTIELTNANVLVLSGPNAGGKTVVLKTIGVFFLMAKCGLFLPCEKAFSQNYENIFVLLGDRQNREEDLSTFSGHLSQIKKIINFVNEKTLVLLDEGFVGTDPAVGVALARAVLEYFAQKNATVIITTHFSSLKTLANDDARFHNASMEFESKNLRPTYKLLNGIPGQSFALELCERMEIDHQIISQARKYYGSEAQRMENILQELQEQKILVKEELYKQKELSMQLQDKIEKIQQEQKSLENIKDTLVDSFRTKLTKRFNAFSNRLDIRERQYQKSQEAMLAVRETNTEPIENSIPTQTIQLEPQLPDHKFTPKKLTSFEDLAKIKIEPIQKTSPLKQTEILNFRQPKKMTHRSLIDEAQESLDVLNRSFDGIEEDLKEELDFTLKINSETKQKAKSIKSNLVQETKASKPAHFWKEGMQVKTEKFREVGTVLKSADSKNLVECQFGPIKVKLFHAQLMTINEAAQKKFSPQKQNFNQKNPIISGKKLNNIKNADIPQVLPHAGNTLDLRGKTVDEALSHLEIILDKMWRSEVSQIVIIHGHGFGKVKEAVRKYLETSSYELSFRPGRQGEGGDGVTVVEFDV